MATAMKLEIDGVAAKIARGADTGVITAVIATPIECCKLSAINPHEWLTETLTRLANGHPTNPVGELMPWATVG